MTTPLNIVFAGTPEFAALHLQALLDSPHNIIAVYSQPDRPAGRGKKLQASPVKQLALDHDIPIYQPDSLREDTAQTELKNLNADLMIVVAYGLILPEVVLNTPKLGCWNVHGSLLPRWRGAAPIQRAIWAGDKETGVTIMQMDEGLDTGDMLLKDAIPIEADDSSATLYAKLAKTGPTALLSCLDKIENLNPEVQNDALANYAKKLSKQEAKMDWSLSAAQLERNVRAFNPWPAAYFELTQDEQSIAVKVWQAEVVEKAAVEAPAGQIIEANKDGLVVSTAEGAIRLTRIQIPGKKAMTFADVFNARKDWFNLGQVLS